MKTKTDKHCRLGQPFPMLAVSESGPASVGLSPEKGGTEGSGS